MFDHENRYTLAIDLGDQLEHAVDAERRQHHGRLVHANQPWPGHGRQNRASAKRLIDKFDALHQTELIALNKRLNELSADSVAWLQAGKLIDALSRYNRHPAKEGGNGELFALQLSVALHNLDSFETGKEFLGGKNPFTDARDNLVARSTSVAMRHITRQCQSGRHI